MRKIAALLVALTLLFGTSAPAGAVSTSASSAVLMDAGSGRVLFEEDMHTPRPIASITKLMTALVAVEETSELSQTITVEPEWLEGVEGSSLYLKAGDQLTLETLLYGLLLQSGNDAAQVIACWIGEDLEGFAQLMNEKARELGMSNTHFTNPSGLNQEEHYSSAYDMALLACACLENPTVASICATQNISLEGRTFVNHNKLLWLEENCVGMKTGYTEASGRTLVSAATRGRRPWCASPSTTRTTGTTTRPCSTTALIPTRSPSCAGRGQRWARRRWRAVCSPRCPWLPRGTAGIPWRRENSWTCSWTYTPP